MNRKKRIDRGRRFAEHEKAKARRRKARKHELAQQLKRGTIRLPVAPHDQQLLLEMGIKIGAPVQRDADDAGIKIAPEADNIEPPEELQEGNED